MGLCECVLRDRENDPDGGQYSCYQSMEGELQRETEQDGEEIKGRISGKEAHRGRQDG